MKKISNLNFLLIIVIIALILSIFTFNYGYELGERKGYVRGVQKCLEGMENHSQQMRENL